MTPCLFCEICAGNIPSAEVFSDDQVLAFRDIDPQAPTHILVIPRRHIASLAELAPADTELLGHLLMTATGIAEGEGLAGAGYRVVVNCGRHGGQAVDHLHVHVLGGRQMAWPPG
ncbi:histidine triad nucleotide-binding protein [bacterium CG_4_9_14_3_um_filter_65_15]|nr:MAG: histidine triad nucleotide-binding protein [bacterium CG_4_9_14_3_um_filter_65_15]